MIYVNEGNTPISCNTHIFSCTSDQGDCVDVIFLPYLYQYDNDMIYQRYNYKAEYTH